MAKAAPDFFADFGGVCRDGCSVRAVGVGGLLLFWHGLWQSGGRSVGCKRDNSRQCGDGMRVSSRRLWYDVSCSVCGAVNLIAWYLVSSSDLIPMTVGPSRRLSICSGGLSRLFPAVFCILLRIVTARIPLFCILRHISGGFAP